MSKGKTRRDRTLHRLDDLRRLATDLAAASGLSRERAAAFASHLLWFDALGFFKFGIAALPDWLDRLDAHEFDVKTEGSIAPERPGTAMLDGRNGFPPLVLMRATDVAGEKAREIGLGLVRVSGLRPSGPSAPFAAELAIGPMVGAVLGPAGSWSLALPSAEGPPILLDSELGGDIPAKGKKGKGGTALPDHLRPWLPLVPQGGWLIAAVAVAAFEPLAAFQSRVEQSLAESQPYRIDPEMSQASRQALRAAGLKLPSSVEKALRRRAEVLGLSFPGDDETDRS